jgi:hypothetical protein
MNLDEALALHLYLDNNTEALREPGKSARNEAWEVICGYAKQSLAERALSSRPNQTQEKA